MARTPDPLTRTAMAGAGLMMAHQVAAKATRDSLFLSQYGAGGLPAMIMFAAVASIGLAVLNSRLMRRFSPARSTPVLFAASGILHLFERFLMSYSPHPGAVVVYVHAVGLGAVLLSAYWSLVNELFDPRTAKRRFGEITGMGTVGGVFGGVMAERLAASTSAYTVLIALGLLHFACAGVAASLGRRQPGVYGPDPERRSATPPLSAATAFRQAPYLVSLAALVLMGTATAAMLDIVFKSQAVASLGKGEPLMRFFAMFYTATAVFSFLLQALGSRVFLEKLGLAATVGSLPVSVSCGSLAVLFLPGLPILTLARGSEIILRGSLFRSAYELFYTPVPKEAKRSAKTIIDVGADRLGDGVGGGVAQLFLTLAPAFAQPGILLTTTAVSIAALILASRLDAAYLQALEKGLVNRAVELDFEDIQDSTTRSVVSRTLSPLRTVAHPANPPGERSRPAAHTEVTVSDPRFRLLTDLRSGNPERVRAALVEANPPDPALVPAIVSLLGWNEMAPLARAALASTAPRIVGQLTDHLLDLDEDFAIRRRIPRLLSACDSLRAVEGLMAGLNDPRFEVRYRCARALDAILQRKPEWRRTPEEIFPIVERELSVSRTVWENYRLLDPMESGQGSLFLDEVLKERANHSLEHVFSLLALALPREPLKIAFRALHTEDRLLRGLALEYLDSALPPAIRERLRKLVQPLPIEQQQRSRDEVLADLMKSNQSVVIRLRELQAGRESDA